MWGPIAAGALVTGMLLAATIHPKKPRKDWRHLSNEDRLVMWHMKLDSLLESWAHAMDLPREEYVMRSQYLGAIAKAKLISYWR